MFPSSQPDASARAERGCDGVDADAVAALGPVFDRLPKTIFFTKSAELTFTEVSTAMVELCGARHRDAMIGKRVSELAGCSAFAAHEATERAVLASGQPMHDQFLSLIRPDGNVAWLLLSCWPLLVGRHCRAGVASLARVLETEGRRRRSYERVSKALDLACGSSARIPVNELADRIGVSVSQLERDFTVLFGVAPSTYFARARLAAAVGMLSGPGTIAEIAHTCGYADQSAFTRRFQQAHGMTPSEFRRVLVTRRVSDAPSVSRSAS